MGRRFFIHMALTLAIAIGCSTAYYYFICYGLRHTSEFFPGRLNCILYDTTRYDAVFMGTSRVCDEIDPLIFDSITHLRSYNAGMEGASFTAIDLFTRRFVANHHPKYVFLNIDIYTMEKENSLYDFPQYYPHLQDSDIAIIAKRKKELAIGKYAPFMAVSYIDDYLKGVAINEYLGINPDDDQTLAHRGFSPVSTMEYHGASANFPLQFSYDTNNFKKLDALCHYCIDHHCELIFIMAPIYHAFEDSKTNAADFYTRLWDIGYRYRVKGLNHYINNQFTKDTFVNQTHLNARGASLYTRLLAEGFIRIRYD